MQNTVIVYGASNDAATRWKRVMARKQGRAPNTRMLRIGHTSSVLVRPSRRVTVRVDDLVRDKDRVLEYFDTGMILIEDGNRRELNPRDILDKALGLVEEKPEEQTSDTSETTEDPDKAKEPEEPKSSSEESTETSGSEPTPNEPPVETTTVVSSEELAEVEKRDEQSMEVKPEVSEDTQDKKASETPETKSGAKEAEEASSQRSESSGDKKPAAKTSETKVSGTKKVKTKKAKKPKQDA